MCWSTRPNGPRAVRLEADLSASREGVGRELFSVFRGRVGRADAGAAVFLEEPSGSPPGRRSRPRSRHLVRKRPRPGAAADTTSRTRRPAPTTLPAHDRRHGDIVHASRPAAAGGRGCGDLVDMERQRRHELGHVRGRSFNHEVEHPHRAPMLGLDDGAQRGPGVARIVSSAVTHADTGLRSNRRRAAGTRHRAELRRGERSCDPPAPAVGNLGASGGGVMRFEPAPIRGDEIEARAPRRPLRVQRHAASRRSGSAPAASPRKRRQRKTRPPAAISSGDAPIVA